MKNHKKLVSIISITLILLAFTMTTLPLSFADPAEWYMSVEGVLDSDYYALYPFEKDDHLSIGFSKYGEFIDPNTGTGLNYSGRDPFANEGVNIKYWLNGWVLDSRYVHRTYGARHLWAFAMFADMVSYGGEWINGATDPYGAPHGGRKTNGMAETEDITVIYDGPRRFVARLVTHLNDTEGDDSWPVLDVIFTIIFNKVKKQMIVLKDIKLTIDSKILEGPVDVQFGDRGEWDLGPAPDWKSYAHFYHQELETCYGADWHLSKNITREFYYHNASFSGTTLQLPDGGSEPYGVPVVGRSEFVYVNNVWQRRGEDYTINYETGEITFTQTLTLDDVKVYYKLYKVDEEATPIPLPHQYDLAQIISSDLAVVGYAAFWPVLSDYTVYGWDHSLEPLYNVSQPDVPTGEPEIPFIIGEWDFMLDYGIDTPNWGKEFRGVTVYGLVDRHDGDDANRGGGSNIIDVEVDYLLDEVFNPWDLYDAVHKDTKRWVEFDYTSTGSFTTTYRPVIEVADDDWDRYCVFSERVIDLTENELEARVGHNWLGQDTYTVTYNTDGTMTISGLDFGHDYKILYSTLPQISDSVSSSTTGSNSFVNLTVNEQMNIAVPDLDVEWTDNLGVTHTINLDLDTHTITLTDTDGNWTDEYETDLLSGTIEPFKVFVEETCVIVPESYMVPGAFGTTVGNSYVWFNVANFTLSVSASADSDVTWPLDGETVHVTSLSYQLHLRANVTFTEYPDGSNQTDVTITYNVTVTYEEELGGRYEWTIVGRDSRAVDSAGAAMVTAAFKNKQVEIGLSGLEMQDTLYGPYIPWIARNLTGTSDARANYNDALGREALKDDWCHTWPVSSSNLITVGGPAANLVTEYFNEFTEAFMIDPSLSDYYTTYGILPLTCWNYLNNFTEGNSVNDLYGYAVIATYKDINGTVGFIVWGWTGQDTYYACKFLHEEIIYELQSFPLCATSILVRINYLLDPEHPTFDVVEVLGTISETTVTEETMVKGGIHPDP